MSHIPTTHPATTHPATSRIAMSAVHTATGRSFPAHGREHGRSPSSARSGRRAAAVAGVLALGATLVPAVQSATPAAAAVSPYAPGTQVSYRTSQQVMVADHTHGSVGSWRRWQWRGTSKGWVRVDSPAYSVFGRNGVVPAARRVQSTDTTPAGTFGFVMAFGVGNPGTAMPYRRVTASSWWDERQSSSTYNRWINGAHGCNTVDCEHLADYTGAQYRQAAVINYNYSGVQHRHGHGSGAGIFLHYARQWTAGCVGVSTHREIDATVRWMDPAQHPVIVIKA